MSIKINPVLNSQTKQKAKLKYNILTRCISIFIMFIYGINFVGCSSTGKDDTKAASVSEIAMSDSAEASDIHVDSDSEPVTPPGHESPVTPPDDENTAFDKEDAKNSGNPDVYFEAVISGKGWTDQVKSLLKEMYDLTKKNYEYRELHNPELKNEYLMNLVSTIDSVNDIVIDPEDEILILCGWTARADYVNNRIVNKYANVVNFRHELAHMDGGQFISMPSKSEIDLAFVLEEGRASYSEGDAMPRTEWIDTYSVDIITNPNITCMIQGVSGSYPAFEEIYKDIKRFGIDTDKMKKESYVTTDIKNEIIECLNDGYEEGAGNKYIELLDEYISYFNNHGKVASDNDARDEEFIAVREKFRNFTDSLYSSSVS